MRQSILRNRGIGSMVMSRAMQHRSNLRRSPASSELPPEPAARIAQPGQASSASPARTLQAHLDEAWRVPSYGAARRWSPRATLALSGGISLLLWGGIALAIVALRGAL